ncbi:MAG: amino acid adenylation domain-containing protein [Candidatus Aminicenantes bacterium]|nr:MAG: amino acid adenylation domain-containing protein [Candidatus Aminicenantes bacterium]
MDHSDNSIQPGEVSSQTGMEIAVIGMAGRFPGARHIDEFWINLKKGIESLSFFSDKELHQAGIEPELLKNPKYVKAKGLLEDIECFDAGFFEYTAKEAEIMDPQLRILQETCWQALEDAGCNSWSYQGLVGLYVGASHNYLWLARFLSRSNANRLTGNELFEIGTLNNNSSFCTRISYKLNLRGPSVFIQTACSTSLVAIHLACQGLLAGECDMALAGGISISIPKKSGYLYQEGMLHSLKGHVRTFDAKADGTVFGNGVGMVVLKPLEDAIAHRDTIHAVIKGSAINNDGCQKVGFTAPGTKGQAAVIRAALRAAEVHPESISYIEAHGTGTTLGDPIEIQALNLAFKTGKTGFCKIGAVKSNIGHLDAAAGVASFIKTVLALKYRMIPPSLNFESPNPEIDFENTPFRVNSKLTEWKNDKYPLRAGVSSFGIGGSNAHVILEEAPAETLDKEGTRGLAPLLKYQLILLSAKTPTALEQMTENLANHLKKNPDINLADAAYTLQVGRKAFEWRRMWVFPGTGSQGNRVADALTSGDSQGFTSVVSQIDETRPVVFMFPGQGAQYVNMGLDLYKTEPLFRKEMDRCFEILTPLMDYDIKEIIYPSDWSDILINQTEIAQPLLFIFEYALAKLLMKWGIKPDAMMGHSIGEYTAACLAGVFSLPDALKAVALRGKLMQQAPGGAMLSISLPEEELIPLLTEEISLAAVNSPESCAVSGTHEAIAALTKELEEKGGNCRRLHTSHAFHSQMMDPILKKFADKVKEIKFNQPGIPYISNLTGNWITVAEAGNPGYWAKHLRETVRFSAGVQELLKKEEDFIFVEVGPGKTLSTFVNQHKKNRKNQWVVNLIKHPKEDVPDDYYLLSKISQLWLHGVTIDWQEFYTGEKRRHIPLPTYPFERRRYWFDGKKEKSEPGVADLPEPGESPGSLYDRPGLSTKYTSPANEIQQVLVNTWQKFFGVDRIGIDDDFFELGGDSLKASIIISGIHKEFNVEVPISEFFRRPTIGNLALFIANNSGKSTYLSIKPKEKKEYYPVSSTQKRLYILNEIDEQGIGYNLSSMLLLEGQLNNTRLEDTFRRLIERHESLRTSFDMIEGEPVQRIHEEVEFAIEYYDMKKVEVEVKVEEERSSVLEGTRGLAPLSKPATALSSNPQPATTFINSFIRPFDLSRAPLLQVGVIKEDDEKHILMVDMHHIIADGTSLAVLIRESMAFYQGMNLPQPRIQYKDFSEWQNSEEVRGTSKQQEEFWLKQFMEEIPLLDLPTDYPRPLIQSFSGCTIAFKLGREETQSLKQFAREEGVTLYILLLAIINILMARLSGQEDIVIGTPILGRRHADLRKIIGMFVNTLAMRNYPAAEITTREFLLNVKERALQAFENQEYQFEELVEKAAVNRDTGRNPLFDVMFVLQNMFEEPEEEISRQEIEGLTTKPYEFENNTSIFDLSIFASEQEEQLFFKFEYCTKLFQEKTILKFIQYFRTITAEVAANPGKKIADIEILSGEDIKQLLIEFNDTKTGYPRDKVIHELYEEQAGKIPGNIALVFEDKALTYQCLNETANKVANYLYSNLNVQWEDRVGLLMERSPDVIPAILGILKAGAAYVPIDASLLETRIKYMIHDADIGVVISRQCHTNMLKRLEREFLCLDSPWVCQEDAQGKNQIKVHPHNLAYVNYTSGTTGLPKGIMIEHRSVINFIKGMTDVIDFKEDDRILSLTTISFDIFGLETILPLTRGSKVVMGNREEQLNPVALTGVIIKEDISIFQLTPSRLYMLLAHDGSKPALELLKYLIVGGDAFPENLWKEAKAIITGKIYNVYGPTETTIWSTIKDVSAENALNIGHPIANTQIYIVDKNKKLLPVRVSGELCIGGDGLARGYLNRPELTAEKFIEFEVKVKAEVEEGEALRGQIPNKHMSHMSHMSYMSYIYKTGDLARWLPDGNLEFLGRIDYQVKIRGFRIELEEIEHRLLEIDYVNSAAVIVKEKENEEKYLCAYIVASREIVIAELKDILADTLPDYMIPSYFVQLEELPITANAKIDRKALISYDINVKSDVEYVPPETEMEKTIADIWREVLQIDQVGLHDNFFDIGGHSLSIVKVNAKLKKVFDKDISAAAMFRYRTISSLVEYFSNEESMSLSPGTKERINESVNLMDEATEVLFADEIE